MIHPYCPRLQKAASLASVAGAHGARGLEGEQGALFWELRIALSLARMRMTQGLAVDARQILAPVYQRFTAGFAAPDLRAAKALLDELPR